MIDWATEFPRRINKAARNMVAFAQQRPGGPAFHPPGFRTGVEYRPPMFRVGEGTETTSASVAEQALMEGWLGELAEVKGEPFQRALSALMMSADVEPPK